MKQKFLVPMLVLLAFGVLLFFSGNSALASRDESTDTAVMEADQPAHEGDDQVVQEEAPVEKEPPAEDKYRAPEMLEDDVNRVESDYEADEREKEQNLEDNGENQVQEEGDTQQNTESMTRDKGKNQVTEGEVTTGSGDENNAPEQNQQEGEPSAESVPAEQQTPEAEN